jgi:hypothetical protein
VLQNVEGPIEGRIRDDPIDVLRTFIPSSFYRRVFVEVGEPVEVDVVCNDVLSCIKLSKDASNRAVAGTRLKRFTRDPVVSKQRLGLPTRRFIEIKRLAHYFVAVK